ncbi:MaoC family dehydratase [Halopenitus persicus]|uniref:MaoC family dehydratase n=1 Tax=Halopenitus persicus TaxID=1048396 RepID=UPI000BBAB7AB|nr:MaoC/PaaZ C-terminal domain-containing protein [Halopenitus persicus]
MPDSREYSLRIGDVEVGDEGSEFIVENLNRVDFVKYGGASGDFHRIHFDEPYAKDAGYESVFGYGMLTAGYISKLITDWFGLAHIRKFSVRFENRTWPGDTIRVAGTIVEKLERDNEIEVLAMVEAINQDNVMVATSRVTAVFTRQ